MWVTHCVAGGLAMALAASGCPKPAPVVQQTTYVVAPEAMSRVAVMPFHPRPGLAEAPSATGAGSEEVATLVSSYVAEALMRKGVSVIPPNDLVIVFTGMGTVAPRLDPHAAASTAAREFGATAVLLGQVYRWRDRGGEALGASQAASVGYEMTLYAAPDARRLWTLRFDETQRALTDNVLNLPRYPGGGTRWLTATELARWGAEHVATALAGGS